VALKRFFRLHLDVVLLQEIKMANFGISLFRTLKALVGYKWKCGVDLVAC